MGGRERAWRIVHMVLVAAVIAWTPSGCDKEDVAPKTHNPGGGWDDGPVQEEPPPPGQENKASAQASDEREPQASDDDTDLPPPEDGNIPLGGLPLPEGTKGVKISGTVTFDDYKKGLIQIDVSDKGMFGRGGRATRPKIITLYRMEKPGPFELEVAANSGEVWLSAYNDADQNGKPTRGEPRGTATGNPYKVGTEDITGVEIILTPERIPPPPGQ